MKKLQRNTPVSDEAVDTVVLVSKIARYYRTLIDRELEPFGVTRSQWWALSHLYFNDGVNQIELANLLEIGKSSAGKLLAKLEDKGWINRVPDARDGRAIRVYLTDDIRPVLERLVDLSDDIVASVMEDFTPEESRTLVWLLTKLGKGFSGKNLHMPDETEDIRREA